jgi:hypothetical protein
MGKERWWAKWLYLFAHTVHCDTASSIRANGDLSRMRRTERYRRRYDTELCGKVLPLIVNFQWDLVDLMHLHSPLTHERLNPQSADGPAAQVGWKVEYLPDEDQSQSQRSCGSENKYGSATASVTVLYSTQTRVEQTQALAGQSV